jgi:hypothetical protein
MCYTLPEIPFPLTNRRDPHRRAVIGARIAIASTPLQKAIPNLYHCAGCIVVQAIPKKSRGNAWHAIGESFLGGIWTEVPGSGGKAVGSLLAPAVNMNALTFTRTRIPREISYYCAKA